MHIVLVASQIHTDLTKWQDQTNIETLSFALIVLMYVCVNFTFGFGELSSVQRNNWFQEVVERWRSN